MNQRSFELKASFPVDSQFAETVAALAEHAAAYAGCTAADAMEFRDIVESLVRESLAGPSKEYLTVEIRREQGPLEAVIGTRRVTWAVAGQK